MLLRIDLAALTVVPDAPPFAHGIQSLPPETWADLTERGYPGIGYWPVIDQSAEYDQATHRLGDVVLTVDAAGQRVLRSREVVPLTPDEFDAAAASRQQALMAAISRRVQQRLDDFAASRGYGDERTAPIVSACSYASSTHARYGVEGRYCLDARERTWDSVYGILADVKAGKRPVPADFSNIEADLPELEWPA